MNDNSKKLLALTWEVKSKFYRPEVQEFLIKFVNDVLKETQLNWDEKITRDFDGKTNADRLIEKMFSELLTNHKTHR